MNHTDQAKLEAAKRMLRGKVDIEEVSVLYQIPLDKLIPIKEEIDEEVRKVYGNTDAYDFNNQVLYDDFNDPGMNPDMPEEEK